MPHDTAALRGRHAALVACFTAAIFVNAALLFSVQPMFTKMVLPLLGGTPSVWNGCQLFFQVALLGGYLYAHLSTRALAPARQGAVHLALLAAALFTLPVMVRTPWVGQEAGPVPWLIGLLVVSLGLPFFALSAGAPMLQRWFASTSHPDAANPYFLYAASNLGSLVALLAYPLLVEPRLRLSEQSRVWSWAYWVLALLVGACALLARRTRAAPAVDAEGVAGVAGPVHAAAGASPSPAPAQIVRWVLLAFVPSSLLLGATVYLSTDVAAVPLLWVVPLALYLLTFIIVFARRAPIPHWAVVWLQPAVLLPLIVLLVWGTNRPLWLIGGLHLTALFATALMCHGELARTRPPAEHLTAFYLWMSFGGALGGVFNVLVAPLAFRTVLEYPIAIVLACALLPAAGVVRRPDDGLPDDATPGELAADAARRAVADEPNEPRARLRRLALDVAGPAAVAAVMYLGTRRAPWPAWLPTEGQFALTALAAGLCLSLRGRPLRFALAAAALFLAGNAGRGTSDDVLYADRSFFGAYRVRQWYDYHHLTHGTTLHGAQYYGRDSTRRLEPLTYYHRDGPLGQLFAALPAGGAPRRVAVVGLGTGTTLCYGRPQDEFTIYEIDPLMVRIAQDRGLFSYMHGCRAKHLRLGDARVRLADAPAAAYDVIVLDAFSSDAIPAHLVTREALQLYLSKLAPGGLVAYHISNRYLDLKPVVAELARDARVAGIVGTDTTVTAAQRAAMKTRSEWVVVARRPTDFAALARAPGWAPLPPRGNVRTWTDDYSDVLGVFTWR